MASREMLVRHHLVPVQGEDDPLIRLAASYREGRRAVIFGPDVGVVCGLMRVGYLHVLELRRGEAAPQGQADLVIVGGKLVDQDAGIEDFIAVITRARRALTAGGHVILSLPVRRVPGVTVAILSALRQAGFRALKPLFEPGRILVAGELGLQVA
jgi:hypothetical protein